MLIKLYIQIFHEYLNNIVEGYKDFKRLNKDTSLDELKTEVDFPYKDFVALEKWYKASKIKSDEEDFNSGKRSKAYVKLPEEVDRVRQEYISYLNELDKAISEEKIDEFFSNPNNFAVAYSSLGTAANSDSDPFPKNLIDRWLNGKHTSSDKLSPRLKQIFRERADESADIDFAKKYNQLAGTLSGLRANLFMAKKRNDQAEVDRITPKLEKCAEEIIKVIIDRLIAIELLAASFNSALFGDFEIAAKRYEKIKQAKLKEHPELKFNPDSEKYRKYYTPEKSDAEFAVDDMYKAVIASLDKMPFNELVQRRLVPVKGVNLPQKRYTDEEIKELYGALQQGDAKLYELLSTDKFRVRREAKAN